MATTTPNLLLTKPELTDPASVLVAVGGNMDIIDLLFVPSLPTEAAFGATPAIGATATAARSDHQHGGISSAAPVAVGTANAEGVAETFSRSDHVHRAPISWFNHVESMIMEAATAEDVEFYLPAAMTSLTLTLRGRTPRAGLLAVHNHGGGSATSGATAAGTTGTHSADHSHSATSGGRSAQHTHAFTSGAESANHGHAITVDSASVAHVHAVNSAGGSHTHIITRQISGTGFAVTTGSVISTSEFVASDGSHTHGNTSSTDPAHAHTATAGTESVAHTHSGATGGESEEHTHSVTTGGVSVGHTHTISATHTHTTTTITTQGVGGVTALSRPSAVSVTIGGIVRFSGLGGSGADWNSVDNDILAFCTPEAWNTITLQSATVGRLKANITGQIT